MIETFLFVRLGEGEVCRNVVWKLQKCYDGVGGGDVDKKPVLTNVFFLSVLTTDFLPRDVERCLVSMLTAVIFYTYLFNS